MTRFPQKVGLLLFLFVGAFVFIAILPGGVVFNVWM